MVGGTGPVIVAVMMVAARGQDDGGLELMTTAEVLVIDDLGTEPMLKNISIEYLMAVLNHRSAKKLPYAVATNLTMAQLMERYGERIVSRLMDRARLVQLTGQDLRLAALRGNA